MKYTGTAGILYDRLKSEILVADGAFGTYYAKKYDTGSLPELANLQASDRVLSIHKEYIEAGAKIIRTNTFASNTVCLGAGFDEVRNNIKNAVDIAREAVKGTDVLVAADIGPIPGENMNEKEHIEKEYVDIVNVFKECGVDIFVFETFPELGFIDKAIENKVIESLSSDNDTNYQILKNIFHVRIIRLEDSYLKITKEKYKYYLQIFDENIFEEKIEIQKPKELEIKLNKKRAIMSY